MYRGSLMTYQVNPQWNYSIIIQLMELQLGFFFFLIRSLYSSTVQAEILMDGSDSEKKYSQPLF